MLVQDFLERSAVRFPDKVALVYQQERLTYRQIDGRSSRIAHALVAAGIQRGDRVAICLENSPEMVFSIFGALRAGAVFLPVNPSVKTEKLTHILNSCRATALILHDRKVDETRDCWEQTPHLMTVWIEGQQGVERAKPGKKFIPLDESWNLGGVSADPPRIGNSEFDLAALLYTSGSTGKPKGVMLTHKNICSTMASVASYLENSSDDVILNVLPLFFGYGLYQVLMAFACGSTMILERSIAFPHAVLSKIAQERVTGMAIVPTIASILLQLDLAKYDLSSLRYLTNAGAALPVDHFRRLRSHLPHTKLFLMYGQTECIRTSFLDPAEADDRPDSVGKAIPDCEVYIVDDHGSRLPAGEVGELVVRGPNVMQGYWELPEETAKVLRPGERHGETVLYSGDLFRRDADGFLYFVSRKDDIMKVCGQRVGPKEIEDVLCRIPGVIQAVVIGVPDPVWGTAIKAILKLSSSAALTAQDVRAFCADHLEDVMVPRFVEFREELPTTDTGKISRHELRTQL